MAKNRHLTEEKISILTGIALNNLTSIWQIGQICNSASSIAKDLIGCLNSLSTLLPESMTDPC
ncbi:hypothetical protein [Sodalis sp. dw_96]|uniref:hypothetical protein n=1 Tax=Sodalis sp. dw_96 TaxID=2719794 RepID=UPI001BD5444C|nr:hypothetical protein [Sodalis sp. dw_96]